MLRDIRARKGKVLGKLYDMRSNVMHGTKVEASQKASEAVRKIAAGVVRAVVCWRTNQEKAGGRTDWKELMDELVVASRKNQEVVGVPNLGELLPETIPV
jgi:uncharacterized protein YwbE